MLPIRAEPQSSQVSSSEVGESRRGSTRGKKSKQRVNGPEGVLWGPRDPRNLANGSSLLSSSSKMIKCTEFLEIIVQSPPVFLISSPISSVMVSYQ